MMGTGECERQYLRGKRNKTTRNERVDGNDYLLTLPIPNPTPIVCHVRRPRVPTTTLSGR